ncbi:hypothetical protein HNQ51_001325 [Inhella inkyongensis]|uniref:Uncharacterized protein n=1 Tax=Inhella inkyongensis TaxID=392593 RepID=A0A840S3B9_9BURK|nr:hypothetical protein [Inhella inkyongensis]
MKRTAALLAGLALIGLAWLGWSDPTLMHRLADAVRSCF